MRRSFLRLTLRGLSTKFPVTSTACRRVCDAEYFCINSAALLLHCDEALVSYFIHCRIDDAADVIRLLLLVHHDPELAHVAENKNNEDLLMVCSY